MALMSRFVLVRYDVSVVPVITSPAAPGSAATRLTSPLFLQLVESRDAQFGAQAGVAFAEGVVVREPLLRAGLLDRWPPAGPA